MDAIALYTAIVLLILIGCIHSFLGEKYILIRLFKRDNLPWLFGGDWFTKQTLRFAWHITTIAWWGFAAILYFLIDSDGDMRSPILLTIALVFVVSGIISLIFSRAKHLSWIVFFAIAATCVIGIN